MKSRWLAITVALTAFGAGSWMLAQTQPGQNNPGQNNPGQAQPGQTQTQAPSQPPTQDPDNGQPKAGDVQNAPKQAPAALPTQDDSQIKHDGSKTDVDAVGNRNVGCGRGVGMVHALRHRSRLTDSPVMAITVKMFDCRFACR